MNEIFRELVHNTTINICAELSKSLRSILFLAAQWIVLTCAHCINASRTMIVYAGIVDWSKFKEGANYQHVKVEDYRRHPKYLDEKFDYDIGLLLLSSPLKFNSNIFQSYHKRN